MPTKPPAHDAHTRKQQRPSDYEVSRPSSRQRGYTSAWDRYSKLFLRRAENVLCRRCKANGRIVRSRCTDHIKPAKYFPELFWEPHNHQGLCVSCNKIKSREDEARYGRQAPGRGQKPTSGAARTVR